MAANGARTSKWKKTYSISLKQIIVILIVILIVISIFAVIFYNIEVHKNWDLMGEEARQYGYWMHDLYDLYGLQSQNGAIISQSSDSQIVPFLIQHIVIGSNCLTELGAIDPGHDQQLFQVRSFFLDSLWSFINDLTIPKDGTLILNSNKTAILINDINGLVGAIPSAYYSTYNWSSDNGEPPFWYFGTDPCNETVLQNAVTLANQGIKILSGLPNFTPSY